MLSAIIVGALNTAISFFLDRKKKYWTNVDKVKNIKKIYYEVHLDF